MVYIPKSKKFYKYEEFRIILEQNSNIRMYKMKWKGGLMTKYKINTNILKTVLQ